MKFLKVLFLIAGLSLFTIACGSSGGGGGNTTSSNFTESPAGIWEGTIESTTTKEKYFIEGVVSENNMIRLVTMKKLYSGTVYGNGNKISTTLTGYASSDSLFPDKSYVASIKISGTISARDHISLTYNGGGDSGTIELTYNNIYERPSDLSYVEGKWEYLPDILEINGSGKVSGTLKFIGSQCMFSGTIKIINPSYNAYLMNITVNNCKDSNGDFNGDYSGLANLVDDKDINDALTFQVSNSTSAIYAYFLKK